MHLPYFLRRRAASALLIQDPEFQTISCVSIRPSDVCPEKTGKTPNGICIGHGARYHSGYFSVDFQDAEEKCVCAVKE